MQENERLGQYLIVGQVGKGGMATVYKAYHERLDRHVAVKVMHNAFTTDDGFITRFEREARIVGKLEHPNIVPIYDYADQNGTPYLVMRYIDGVTLKQKALKTGLTLKETLSIMSEVADALDYAHAQGVLHRDMKPSNILIDRDGKAYITDFGLARMAQLGESTISHDMMLGTPFYISPEQAQGVRDLTPSTDIYSLGIILYELVTGSVPFVADSTYAIIHGHIYQAPKPPSQINPDLNDDIDRVFERALAKDPKDRYPTARAMLEDFRKAIEPELNAPLVQSSQAHEPERKPAPQAPSMPAPAPKVKGEKVYKVEAKLELDRLNWSQVGQRLKQGVVSIADKIESAVDGEVLKRMGLVEDDTERIRKRVEKRLKEREALIGHAVAYVTVNVMLWVGFLLMMRTFPFWMIFVTCGWGIGMFTHWREYYTKYGEGARRRDREIQAEVERELAMMSNEGRMKRKNDVSPTSLDALLDDERPAIRLTEEGEFTDSFVQETRKKRKK
jgi:serine/threonine-protein kinase